MTTSAQAVTVDHILGSRVVGRIFRYFVKDGRPHIAKLIALGLVGLAVPATASLLEGRFAFGSVHRPDSLWPDSTVEIAGMSFLGDPMVWPFCILVPSLMFLTIQAARFLASFMSSTTAARHLDGTAAWAEVFRPPQSVRSRGFLGLLVRHPIATPQETSVFLYAGTIGAVVVAFNFLNCGLSSFDWAGWPLLLDPDNHRRCSPNALNLFDYPYCIPGPGGQLVWIPKWDCECGDGLFSNLASRAWVAVFYVLPCLSLAYIYRMIVYLNRSLRLRAAAAVPATATDDDVGVTDATPFLFDGHDGIDDLRRFCLTLAAVSFSMLILTTLSMFKEATPAGEHNYVLMVAAVLVSSIALVFPYAMVSRFISDVQAASLPAIADRMADLGRRILADPQAASPALDARLRSLTLLHDRVLSVRALPVQTTVLLQAAGALPGLVISLLTKFL